MNLTDYLKGLYLKLYLKFLKSKRDGGELKKHFIFPSPDDARDYVISGEAPSVTKFALNIDPYFYGKKNQGIWNSCALHALATAMEIGYKVKGKQLSGIELSERYPYYYIRIQEGHPNENVGTYIRDTLSFSQRYGISPEKLCPYISSEMNIAPTDMADGFAKIIKIKEYFRIIDLDTLKESLELYYMPVIMGIHTTGSFNSNTGEVLGSGESKNGGHGIVCYGFDDETQELLIINSWGTNWKDRDIARLPYQFYENNCFEAWLPTI